MPKSGYLARQQEVYKELFSEGMKTGEQYTMDCVMIALHRQGWGYDRIKRLFDLVRDVADSYGDALRGCMEQDICQERMDNELRDFIKDRQEFIPFRKRYPMVRTLGYDRLPKR